MGALGFEMTLKNTYWEFLDLVVLNLVVCKFHAEVLFCALLRSFAPFCALLRSFADLRLRSFALFCAHLRVSASNRV